MNVQRDLYSVVVVLCVHDVGLCAVTECLWVLKRADRKSVV